MPLAVFAVLCGGLWLFGFVGAVLSVAVFEFCRMMERESFQVPLLFALATLWVVLLDVQFPQWDVLTPGVALVLMTSLAWQLAHREGAAVANWALGIAGPLYVGWCGAYIIRVRGLPEGEWWLLTVLPAIWLADSGAYLIGQAWGRHRLAPTLSPGKTWEGYVGGIVVGTLSTAGLAALWGRWAGPSGPTPFDGLGIGLLISVLAPLGDLIVSMMKREVGVKDTGVVFPGHGGALDRIDSVLWAVVIGYYFAIWVRGL